MDVVDKAQAAETRYRQRAIKQATEAPTDTHYIIEGVICCCDCLIAIPNKRLNANPNAARCIDCQQDYEQQRITTHG